MATAPTPSASIPLAHAPSHQPSAASYQLTAHSSQLTAHIPMPTSDKQIQANRRNALKSTGPTTPQGKRAVRQNPLKHGILARDTVHPSDAP